MAAPPEKPQPVGCPSRGFVLTVVLAVLGCGGGSPSGGPVGPQVAGHACTSGDECQSGWCINLPTGKACAALCAGECSGGLVCKRAEPRDPASLSICVPPESHLCEFCAADIDCGAFGDLCLPRDGAMYCGLDCSETQSCPEGFSCAGVRDANGQEVARQCVPQSGTCTCSDPNAGAKRPCQKTTAGIGTCPGAETCVPGAGWVSCDARTPVPELCDRQDNDCDGAIDENNAGQPLSRPCGYGPEPRRQECTGVETCENGVYGPCSVPPPPADELICDGLDEDCDGVPDDGVMHTPNDCRVCGDVCPPGPLGDTSTLRSCLTDVGDYYCGPIACRVPYFDMNGLESDGCELADDHRQVGDTVILNATWQDAFPVGVGTIGCSDSDVIASCGLHLPTDDRQHVPAAPPVPQVDYHEFYQDDSIFCVVETGVCAYFTTSTPADDLVQIEFCISPAQGSLGVPTFPPNRCWSLTLGTSNWIDITLNNSGNEYFYVRVRALSGHYAGTYAVAAHDADGCPLAAGADPCTY